MRIRSVGKLGEYDIGFVRHLDDKYRQLPQERGLEAR